MIKLALIGKGKWGNHYLEAIKNIPGAEIKYVVTRNYRDLHKYNDIDGIIIATPDSTHAEIAQEFPDKYLLIEKPFTTSLKDALEIKNQKIMVGHIYLYNKLLMEKLDKTKNIKSLKVILRNTEVVKGTNPLFYLAPHGISLSIYLFGVPKRTRVKEINENLYIELLYPKVRSTIEVGWNYPKKERIIEVKGDNGFLFTDSEKQEVSPLENELSVFIGFIKGGKCTTGIKHAVLVERILDNIEKQLKTV